MPVTEFAVGDTVRVNGDPTVYGLEPDQVDGVVVGTADPALYDLEGYLAYEVRLAGMAANETWAFTPEELDAR